MKTVPLIFLLLGIASLGLSIVSALKDNNHGVVTGLIGLYGNLILSKLHNKD